VPYACLMHKRVDRVSRSIPVMLGGVTLASVGVLLVSDIFPKIFPAKAHGLLAAFPLTMIACAYFVYRAVHRPAFAEMAKGILLASAFLFWAANQLWPDLRQATLFNDIAIGLFVLDVFLIMRVEG
jgi:hypothetical protein